MRRAARAGLAVLTCSLAAVPLSLHPAQATPAPSSVDRTVTVSRTFVKNGVDVPVDTRTVSLHVSRTTGLRDRDSILVSWTGAHPTGGAFGDIHSADAAKEEYPMVLLECRGVDSPTAPVAQRLTPETCFTQSPVERYTWDYNTSWPEWRMDRYATGDDLALQVGLPAGKTSCAPLPFGAAVYNVPFVAANGTAYGMAQGGCAGMPPEMSALATTGLPSNSTYGVTEPDGRGSVQFDVRTVDSNPSLGCSDTVACSLVAVPVMGISCNEDFSNLPSSDRPTDPDEISWDESHCTATGHYASGTPTSSNEQQRTVTGALWWSASNWRGRISVPLSFALPSNVCDVVGGGSPLYLYGSELMIQAMTSWAPHFCLTKGLFPLKHVQTGEPQARSLLKNGTVHGALTSDSPDGGYPQPVVSAPVAMTGFTVGFTADDTHGLPVSHLDLTPRLLAKLLTESYPALPDIKNTDVPLSHNPLNMLADPEFIALNPGLPKDVSIAAAATLFSLSSDSDVIHALTSYLQADPEARAWLDGTPDPWGMVVNPAYKGIALPVSSWPLLDTFVLKPPPSVCLQESPAPYLNLVAAPTQRIPTISLALQYALSPSPGTCIESDNGTVGNKLTTAGAEAGGHRFLLGVTSLGDAERFGLGEASLLSHTDTGAAAKFTDSTGRTFVAPSDTSLAAAAQLLTPDSTKQAWQVDPAVLRSAPTGAAAYPGAMLVDAAVPTSGLPSAEAARYATFLTWASTSGQVPGTDVGQLPAGYLPMTAANGMAAQVDFTQRAARAVAAQAGDVVPLVATASAPSPAAVAPAVRPRSVTSRPPAGAAPASGSAPVAVPLAPMASHGPLVRPGAVPAPVIAAGSLGRTMGSLLGQASEVLPALVLLGLVAAAAAAPGLLVRRGKHA